VNRSETVKKRRGKYWVERRTKRLDSDLFLTRLACNKAFRRFVTLFYWLSKSGSIFTPRRLHRACISDGLRIALSSIYNYVKTLDKLNLVSVHSDGARTYFCLRTDTESFGRLADAISAQIERERQRMQ
jgi:hypothetical protein